MWMGPAEESTADVGISSKKTQPRKEKKTSTHQELSASVGEQLQKKRKSKDATEENPKEDFKGDHVLAWSIVLIRKSIWAHECAYAVAEGDLGRVYKILKVCCMGLWQDDINLTFSIGHVIHFCRLKPYQVYNIPA